MLYYHEKGDLTWSLPGPKSQLICSAELRPGVERNEGVRGPYVTSAPGVGKVGQNLQTKVGGGQKSP